jgi:signal transduction histidine kinase
MPSSPTPSVVTRASLDARRTSTAALVALVYLCSGELGFLWIVPVPQAAAVAPLFATGFALCLLWGYAFWPLVFLGSLALGVGSGLWHGPYNVGLLGMSACVALLATLHSLSGVFLVRAIAGLKRPLLLALAQQQRPRLRRLEIEVLSAPPLNDVIEVAAVPEPLSSRDRERFGTLLRERTAELEDARSLAERANRARSQFLANMTHELRTPMHAVLSYAQLGRDASTPSEQRDYFERIAERGHALLHLLSNLLDLARLEAGSMSLELAPHDLDTLLRDQLRVMDPVFQSKRVAIEYRRAPDCDHASVIVDPVRIGQVFHNILANAVRYSPSAGRIKIALGRAAPDPCRTDRGAQLEIAISDEGVGIPEGELELIFDKFVESSKTRTNAGGTGLGLTLCRQIVELHDGTIVAANNPGPGTTVRVVLPLAASTIVERGAA